MREYIFHGKSKYGDKWVEGCLIHQGNHYLVLQHESKLHPMDVPYIDDFGCIDGRADPVIPESVGQYTGMNEFMLTDETRNAKLFEGDIVEVWGWRSVYGRNQSQYDKRVRVRGVIYFGGRGQWLINYDNKYNEELAKLKGSETDKREAHGAYDLYWYGYHGSDIEKYRAQELEWHGRFHNKEDIVGHSDVVKIGTVFENADLLEG
jgi:hypothetical protein